MFEQMLECINYYFIIFDCLIILLNITVQSLVFTANMPITPHCVVSSFPYRRCLGSSLWAAGCCFSSWCTVACSSISDTSIQA